MNAATPQRSSTGWPTRRRRSSTPTSSPSRASRTSGAARISSRRGSLSTTPRTRRHTTSSRQPSTACAGRDGLERDGPSESGAGLVVCTGRDRELAAEVGRAPLKVRQPTACDIGSDAAAVVVDEQLRATRVDVDGDVDGGRFGVPGHVAERLAEYGDHLFADRGRDERVDRTVEL